VDYHIVKLSLLLLLMMMMMLLMMTLSLILAPTSPAQKAWLGTER